MGIIDLNMARVEREEDNTKVGAEDLLRLVLKDITSGEIKNVKRAAIVIVREGEDGVWEPVSYRCGLNRSEEIGLLTAHTHQRIADWME